MHIFLRYPSLGPGPWEVMVHPTLGPGESWSNLHLALGGRGPRRTWTWTVVAHSFILERYNSPHSSHGSDHRPHLWTWDCHGSDLHSLLGLPTPPLFSGCAVPGRWVFLRHLAWLDPEIVQLSPLLGPRTFMILEDATLYYLASHARCVCVCVCSRCVCVCVSSVYVCVCVCLFELQCMCMLCGVCVTVYALQSAAHPHMCVYMHCSVCVSCRVCVCSVCVSCSVCMQCVCELQVCVPVWCASVVCVSCAHICLI